ncbi:hypothetical protein ACSSS7_003966 [Eimeria intestinalis]
MAASSSGAPAEATPGGGGPSPPLEGSSAHPGGPSSPPGGPPPPTDMEDRPNSTRPPHFGLDLDAPVRGISINVQGLQNVRPETIAPELRGFEGVQTVRELLLAVEASQERLSDLNLFSLLTSELNCGEGDGDVSVTFRLKELSRRYNFGVNINGRGQAEVEAAADIPGLAGGSKSLHLSVATAPTDGASRMVSATLGAPRLPYFLQRAGGPLFSRGLLRIFSSSRDMGAYTSTTTASTGATAELRSRDGTHALIAGYTLRDISPMHASTRIPSSAVMGLPWRSIKHSLRYTYTRNRLDLQQQQAAAAAAAAAANNTTAPSPAPAVEEGQMPVLLPRRGYAVQTAAEAALPGGDARFFKAEMHAFAATPISLPPINNSSTKSSSSKSSSSGNESPWVLTGRIGVGALLTPRGAPLVSLEDKFYFTKMTSPLRGFKSYAVGPSAPAYVVDKDRGVCMPVHDYLGGDAYFASEICLSYDFRLPKTTSITTGSSISSSISSSSSSISSSSNSKGFGGYHPRWFVFGSVGALGDVFHPPMCQQHQHQEQQQQQQQHQQGLSSLFKEWRCSMGLGVAFPLSRGIWAELALALPVRRADTDQPERFQVGFKVASVDLGQ